MVKLDATKHEMKLIKAISKRVQEMDYIYSLEHDVEYPLMEAMMDINACHSNGNPLRLKDLLEADNFNFMHDVFGIRRHINRETGELENLFSPRFTSRAKIAA